MNYFSYFGLPACYEIDKYQLDILFYELQSKYHPDKFINNTHVEKSVAMRQSAIINQAWKTLRNPLTRAEYLLSLHGFNFDNEKCTIYDEAFLIRQLELYENLDKIKREKDEVQLQMFIKHIKAIFDNYHQKMVKQLNQKEWNEAADTVRKLRFLEKLNISAEELEEKLFNF